MRALNDSKPSLEVPRDIFKSWKNFRTPGGTPKDPTRGTLEVQRGSLENLMIKGMLVINFTQILALKTNTGSEHLLDFESDSHRVTHGGPGSPLGGLRKT